MARDGYYGFIGTMDVYGLQLKPGQGSAAAVWVVDDGDGASSNRQNIMIGWDVSSLFQCYLIPHKVYYEINTEVF